jgi:hypothetical protein
MEIKVLIPPLVIGGDGQLRSDYSIDLSNLIKIGGNYYAKRWW